MNDLTNKMEITCPKCGMINSRTANVRLRITWHDPSIDSCSYAQPIDHLHSYCLLCGYDGIEFVFSTKDQKAGQA